MLVFLILLPNKKSPDNLRIIGAGVLRMLCLNRLVSHLKFRILRRSPSDKIQNFLS